MYVVQQGSSKGSDSIVLLEAQASYGSAEVHTPAYSRALCDLTSASSPVPPVYQGCRSSKLKAAAYMMPITTVVQATANQLYRWHSLGRRLFGKSTEAAGRKVAIIPMASAMKSKASLCMHHTLPPLSDGAEHICALEQHCLHIVAMAQPTTSECMVYIITC